MMGSGLNEDLERFAAMAFVRAADCTEVIHAFHRLSGNARRHPDFELLERVYRWVFVPLSVWPVDVRGLCAHLLDCVSKGSVLDEGTRLLCSLLPEAPLEEVCDQVSEYEHEVKTGSYESLIHAQFKFDLMEEELARNPELRADWEQIKARFDVDKYRNAQGVIRRRMAQERNFRPKDWKFGLETDGFQHVFDAFCHKWDLYGMQRTETSNFNKQASGKLQDSKSTEGRRGSDKGGDKGLGEDRPLLMKLTVNLTPFGTMIMVPRYWSFDPRRDLKWKEITRLHRTRCESKQGVKLSSNQTERRAEAARAAAFWKEATAAGFRGERRSEWVMEKLGWDARTDESRLRRLLKNNAKC